MPLELFSYNFSAVIKNKTTICFTYQIGNGNPELDQGQDNLVKSLPNISVPGGSKLEENVEIQGINPGHLLIGVKSASKELGE